MIPLPVTSSPSLGFTERLTTRERQVLSLSLEGLSAKEIGARLGLCRTTVEAYKQRIRLKVHVKSERELMKLAIASGMLTLQDAHQHLELLGQLKAA